MPGQVPGLGGWLGVQLGENPEGVVVLQVVAETPAELAGFRDGDLVVRFNGREVRDLSLMDWISLTTPGTAVEVVVERDGEQLILVPVIGDRAEL